MLVVCGGGIQLTSAQQIFPSTSVIQKSSLDRPSSQFLGPLRLKHGMQVHLHLKSSALLTYTISSQGSSWPKIGSLICPDNKS